MANEIFSGFLKRSKEADAAIQVPALTGDLPSAGTTADRRALVEIELAKIEPNPDQPRKDFDEGELALLAESIKRHGLLEPIIVYPWKVDERGEPVMYRIRAGERRWRASKLVGTTILARVFPPPDPSDPNSMLLDAEVTHEENAMRTDFNIIEEARSLAAIRNWRLAVAKAKGDTKVKKGTIVTALASQYKINQQEIYRRLRILEAPAYLKDVLGQRPTSENLTRAQVYALADYANTLYEQVVADPDNRKGKALHDAVKKWLDEGGEPGEEEDVLPDADASGGPDPDAEDIEETPVAQTRIDPAVPKALANYCKARNKKLADARAMLRSYTSSLAEAGKTFRRMVDNAADPTKKMTAAAIRAAEKKMGVKAAQPTPAVAPERGEAATSEASTSAVEADGDRFFSVVDGRLTVAVGDGAFAGASRATLVAARSALADALATIDGLLEQSTN